MGNPFEFGRALDEDELVDRESETQEVLTTLLTAQRLFLIGPRRFGKTSILRVAGAKANRSGAHVFRYDAEAFPTLESLAERLLADAIKQLTPSVERAGQALGAFFKKLRPQASVDPQTGGLSVSVTFAEGRGAVPMLIDVFDGIERLAEQARHPVAVILDEFQKVVSPRPTTTGAGGQSRGSGASDSATDEAGRIAESQIRAAIQHHRHVAYVFAGSDTRLLSAMTSDPSRPFYKLGTVLSIGAIPRGDFEVFLETKFAAAGVAVEPGAAAELLDAAEEVPYNVQQLAHACWDACRNTTSGSDSPSPVPLTKGRICDTRDAMALRADPLYTLLWNRLSSKQQQALVALLREGEEGLTSSNVLRRYRMAATTMYKSLRSLETTWHVLREHSDRGTTRLKFEDPLFAAWIRLVVMK